MEFTTTSYNTGDYNETSGIFTCPIKGIYLFTASADVTGNVTFQIQVNALPNVYGFSQRTGYANYKTAHVVYDLSPGDKVWVQHGRSGDVSSYLDITFTGTLITTT